MMADYEKMRNVLALLYTGQKVSVDTSPQTYRGTIVEVQDEPEDSRDTLPAPKKRFVCDSTDYDKSGDYEFLIEIMQSGRVRVVQESYGPTLNAQAVRAGF